VLERWSRAACSSLTRTPGPATLRLENVGGGHGGCPWSRCLRRRMAVP